MADFPGNLLWAGTITAPHGLKGALKVHSSPDRVALLQDRRQVVLRHPQGELDPRQVVLTATGKQGFFLHLEDVDKIEEAEKLRGCDILIDPSDLPEDPDSATYPFKLIGMAVMDRERGKIGTVENFFATAAHGILVVEGLYGEVLIPFLPCFLEKIDWNLKQIAVALPAGLIAET